MTPHNAAVLACRVLALLAILLSIRSILNFIGILPLILDAIGPDFSWAALQPYIGGSLGDSLGGIVLLNFALLLWFFAPTVAKWITRGMQDDTVKDTPPATGRYTMAVALAGFLLLGTADISTSSFLMQSAFIGMGNIYSYLGIACWLLHFFLGMLLVFRCRAVAEWILRKEGIQT